MSYVRRSLYAGQWFPADASALHDLIEDQLRQTPAGRDSAGLVAIVVPHAGLAYSGTVAAAAYQQLAHFDFDSAILLGPSHYVSFEGTSIYPRGAFETPFGQLGIDESLASDISSLSDIVREIPETHMKEHCLEMQLPFLQYLAPTCRIVPLIMGHQTALTIGTTAIAIASAVKNCDRRVLLIASSDLSHYESRKRARELDAEILTGLDTFDAERLQTLMLGYPRHACGGGPIISILRAARELGATESAVLLYGDSGDVTGDLSSVVGYVAAGCWRV